MVQYTSSKRNTTYPLPKSRYISSRVKYSDVFSGIGTLPGDEYHIKLKKILQTSPASTQVSPSQTKGSLQGKALAFVQ